ESSRRKKRANEESRDRGRPAHQYFCGRPLRAASGGGPTRTDGHERSHDAPIDHRLADFIEHDDRKLEAARNAEAVGSHPEIGGRSAEESGRDVPEIRNA